MTTMTTTGNLQKPEATMTAQLFKLQGSAPVRIRVVWRAVSLQKLEQTLSGVSMLLPRIHPDTAFIQLPPAFNGNVTWENLDEARARAILDLKLYFRCGAGAWSGRSICRWFASCFCQALGRVSTEFGALYELSLLGRVSLMV